MLAFIGEPAPALRLPKADVHRPSLSEGTEGTEGTSFQSHPPLLGCERLLTWVREVQEVSGNPPMLSVSG